ncbi:MAG: DMT family transporter [Candidatus Melainabacteria bacterium]
MIKLNKGICFGLLAAFNFSLMALFAKIAHLPIQEVIFTRSLFNLIASYIAIRRKELSIWGGFKNLPLLFMRGLAGYLSLSAYFFSLKALPIGEASLIQYMSPAFSGVIAFWIIGESISWKQWICLFFGFIGIGFVSRVLPFGELHIASGQSIYWIACICSSLLSAVAYTFVRKLSLRGENGDVIIFYFPLVSLPLSFLPFILGWQKWVSPDFYQWLLIVGIGITSYAGQVFLTESLKLEKTARAANMLYFGALFGSIWGAVFLKDPITWGFAIGALIIIGSQLLFGKKEVEESRIREKMAPKDI